MINIFITDLPNNFTNLRFDTTILLLTDVWCVDKLFHSAWPNTADNSRPSLFQYIGESRLGLLFVPQIWTKSRKTQARLAKNGPSVSLAHLSIPIWDTLQNKLSITICMICPRRPYKSQYMKVDFMYITFHACFNTLFLFF